MSRRSEIDKALTGLTAESKIIISPLIDEIVFIENNLESLKALPFISVNPKNPMQQRYTVAYKQYKELYQQYTVGVKILLSSVGDMNVSEDSPLQKYFKDKLKRAEAVL